MLSEYLVEWWFVLADRVLNPPDGFDENYD